MRLSTKRWDKGSELRITERLSLRVFVCLFVCFVVVVVFLPSYIPHVSMHFEKSRSPVDDLELCDDQRRKSARIISFLSSSLSGFRQ